MDWTAVSAHQKTTDPHNEFRKEFRKERRTYYIEVELDSSGDIESKIRSYEDYLEDNAGQLVVVCKHRQTAERIRRGKWIIPVMCLDLAAVKDQWAGA